MDWSSGMVASPKVDVSDQKYPVRVSPNVFWRIGGELNQAAKIIGFPLLS